MTLKQIIDADFQVVEADMEQPTFTWDGQDYVYVPGGTNQESAMLELGGFGGDLNAIINVRKSVFADGVYPEKEQIITLDGTDYEIDHICDDATKTFFVIYLKYPSP